MNVYRVRTIVLAFCLFFILTCASLPAQAQNPGPIIEELTKKVEALTARVAKLEGNITAADLAGTYTLSGLGHAIGGSAPTISQGTFVIIGTVTLAENGTGSVSVTLSGFQLSQGVVTTFTGPATGPIAWTYSNGALTLDFLDPSDPPLTFAVTAGGRVAVAAGFDPDSSTPGGDNALLTLTRLK